MHRHDPGEVYHVLEGEFTFYVGDPRGRVERITATAGQVMPLAGGTPHTIRNESRSDTVAFVVHGPGPPMEQFSRAGGRSGDEGRCRHDDDPPVGGGARHRDARASSGRSRLTFRAYAGRLAGRGERLAEGGRAGTRQGGVSAGHPMSSNSKAAIGLRISARNTRAIRA
jgi:hypothetical protein